MSCHRQSCEHYLFKKASLLWLHKTLPATTWFIITTPTHIYRSYFFISTHPAVHRIDERQIWALLFILVTTPYPLSTHLYLTNTHTTTVCIFVDQTDAVRWVSTTYPTYSVRTSLSSFYRLFGYSHFFSWEEEDATHTLGWVQKHTCKLKTYPETRLKDHNTKNFKQLSQK